MFRSLFIRTALMAFLAGLALASPQERISAAAQEEGPLPLAEPPVRDRPPAAAASPPRQVDVAPLARDEEIQQRLERILRATGWFEEPRVQVEEGVVFLSGTAVSIERRRWAADLASNTQDVVAVVNRLDVSAEPVWDLEPVREGIDDLTREAIRWLPFVLVGFVILAVAWLVSLVASSSSRRLLKRRVESPLLREVFARALGAAILLFGLYLVLRVSGLTRLALTVIGGTGLLGLVIGIAFRDITENFLASIFLSIQRPFETGDLVEIVGVLGFVQRLTVRTTIVMTLDGNHVQIPNSMVYKNTIRNFTSNPNRREDFTVGIDYEVPIAHAQEVALAALAGHPAVLKEPEPWVLADSLGPSTVNLRVFFWLNGTEHSWLKVRSAVIRLVKRAFQDAGISMPDEAREIVFPRGVQVEVLQPGGEEPAADGQPPKKAPVPRPLPEVQPEFAEPVSTGAEAGLRTEAGEIEGQARRSRTPELGEDLLATGR
jgi:small conductance mechanosensitive channel